MDSSLGCLASDVLVGAPRLDRHSSTSATASQDTSQLWSADVGSYSEEETDFLNEVLLQDTGTEASGVHEVGVHTSTLQPAASGLSATSSDVECDWVVPTPGSFTSTASMFHVPANTPALKLQLNYSDVISTWERMTAQRTSDSSKLNLVQPAHDELNSIRSAQYQLPPMLPGTASAPTTFAHTSFVSNLSALPNSSAAPASHMVRQAGMPFGNPSSSMHGLMSARCTSLPLAPGQGCSNVHTGYEALQDRAVSVERYRGQKASRPSAHLTARNQIQKKQADNKHCLQGISANASKLAELQMEAATSSERSCSTSPMLSGGSSNSAFL